MRVKLSARSSRVRALGYFCVVYLGVGGCAHKKTGEVQPQEAGTSGLVASAASDTAPGERPDQQLAAPHPGLDDFRLAMRVGDFQLAVQVIDGLSAEEKSRASVRYAYAYAARRLGNFTACVENLTELEKALPVLGGEIAEARAHCQLEAGPYEAAAKYFSAQNTSRDFIRAGLAYERGGALDKSLAAALQVISREAQLRSKLKGAGAEQRRKNSLEREAEARQLRARVYRKQNKVKEAEQDERWVAMQTPELTPEGPAPKLTKQQHYERAMKLAADGEVEKVEAELQALAGASGPDIKQAEIIHARAWALYVARRYVEAAPLLERAHELGSVHAISDYYYAARAWSRQHEDLKAIQMYEGLAKRYPGSSFAERSRYMAARLRYILGDWAAAEKAYIAYMAQYGAKGRHIGEARYELAVSLLASGKYDKAQPALNTLALAEKDERAKGLLQQLEGVAWLGRGERGKAIALFSSVIEQQPLSFAALVSRARLVELGQSPPALIGAGIEPKPAPSLVIQLPPKVQALHEAGLSLYAENELGRQEAAFRKLYPGRESEALCRAYGELGTAERAYRVGQAAVRLSQLAKAPSSETRWAWECIYPEPFQFAVAREAEARQVPKGLVYALMRQESAFRPHVVSPAKAIGLMQLIPPTAREVAKELSVEYQAEFLKVPAYNIRFGVYYLKKVLDQFSGSMPLALAAYNAGPQAVGRWLKTGEQLPLDIFVARIPYGETRGYVGRVLGNLARYAYLEGGLQAVPELKLELPSGVVVPADAY